MKDARILPLLGPAAVLYLVADVASVSGGLPLAAWAIAGAALLASLAPLMVRGRADDAGARRIGVLGVALGVGLVGAVSPGSWALAVDVLALAGVAAAGGLLLDLSLCVPDRPRPLDRGGLVRVAPTVVAGLAGIVGILAVLPPWRSFGTTVITPWWWALVPVAWALVALMAAVVLRGLRRRMGSAPEALAANTWALIGLIPSAVAAGVGASLVTLGRAELDSIWVRGLFAFAVVAAVGGHVAMIDSRRRLSAGRTTRAVASTTVVLIGTAAAVAAVRVRIPDQPFTLGLAVVATALVAIGLHRVLVPLVHRLFAPWGGRLLHATDRAEQGLLRAASLEEVARAVLGPLRSQCLVPDAEIYLYTSTPDREATIDAAGEPHVSPRPMPSAIARRIEGHPGEIIVRAALERVVVRRPELRELVEVLVRLDALCVIPLVAEGEVEGAVIVPRGRRRSALSLEEIVALERLALRLCGPVALLLAKARAQGRAGDADVTRKDLEERIEQLEESLERQAADARVLKAGRAADRMTEQPIAYSPAMRALTSRIRDVGPMDGPVLLVADPGSAVDRIAHMLHDHSGRAESAFVIANCGAVRRERAAAALFGEEGDGSRPGWLRLAEGGSLLLLDVPALPLDVQRELAEALGTRQARAVDGAGSYPVDVRVIATARQQLEPLEQAGAFDPELLRWLSALSLEVPPLRERREDLDSLVLLALDRACRVFGGEPIGIDAEAMRQLAEHEWPGNLRELQWVVDRAVAVASGDKVRAEDLPPLAPAADAAASADPFEGTYAELERRVLLHALERAGGNKSEAARLLGLKRTTFLDKLRRHDVSDVEPVELRTAR